MYVCVSPIAMLVTRQIVDDIVATLRSLSLLLPYTFSLLLYVNVSYVAVATRDVATHSPVTSFVEQCGSEFNLLYLRWLLLPHRHRQTD